jgi:pre-mRNA-splicing factor SYF1
MSASRCCVVECNMRRVHKSTKIWTMYLDLEESLGTVATTKAAYDRALELRVATPQMVLNYAAYLEDREYWEESFRVFEKGVSLFQFPHAKPIWTAYLDKFVARYKGTKLERARDLFEQVLTSAPLKDASEYYIK